MVRCFVVCSAEQLCQAQWPDSWLHEKGRPWSESYAGVQYEHAAILKDLQKEMERYEKLEKKLKITTHGYVTREKALMNSIQQAWASLQVDSSTSGPFSSCPFSLNNMAEVCRCDVWIDTQSDPQFH